MDGKLPAKCTGRTGDIIPMLTPLEAVIWLREGAVLLDLRRPYETCYRTLDVPKVLHVPWKELALHVAEIPRDCPLVLLDNAGVWSRRLYPVIRALTEARVAVISGGILAWIEDGLPILTDKSYALSGQCSCKLRPQKPYPKRDQGKGSL